MEFIRGENCVRRIESGDLARFKNRFKGFKAPIAKALCLKIIFSVWVSLPLSVAEVMAQGSVEISSPEESVEASLSSLLFPPDELYNMISSGVDLGAIRDSAQADMMGGDGFSYNPLLARGILPYQIDPISAFAAATIVLSIQAIREARASGKPVDLMSVVRILDDTRFHAAWIGAGVGAFTRRQLVNVGSFVADKTLSEGMKELTRTQIFKIVGTVVNGLTYTVAVASSWEYFSQFWMIMTRNIPNTATLSELATKATKDDFNRVWQSFFTYLLNADFQKRIVSSVKNNRIMTAEFILMNVGLWGGLILGKMAGSTIDPKYVPLLPKSWKAGAAKYIGTVLGGVIGGALVQFVPDSFKMKVNRGLLDHKIRTQGAKVDRMLARLKEGVEEFKYSDADYDMDFSFFATQINLDSDINRLLRTRDMLNSLLLQRMFILGEEQNVMDDMDLIQAKIQNKLDEIYLLNDALSPEAHHAALQDMMRGAKDPDELRGLAIDYTDRKQKKTHYAAVLGAAQDRLDHSWAEFHEFVQEVSLLSNQAEQELDSDY